MGETVDTVSLPQLSTHKIKTPTLPSYHLPSACNVLSRSCLSAKERAGNAGKVQTDQAAPVCAVRSRRMDSLVLEPQTDGDGRMGPSSPHRDDKLQKPRQAASQASCRGSCCNRQQVFRSGTSWSGCQTPTFSRRGIPLCVVWVLWKWGSNKDFTSYRWQLCANYKASVSKYIVRDCCYHAFWLLSYSVVLFPQKSEETNPVLVLNGLALSTCVISRCSQLFRVLSIRMRSGWCLTGVSFDINFWMRTDFQWTSQKHSRQLPWWENPRLDLLGVLSRVRSAFCLLLRNLRNPRSASPASYSDPVQSETRCEVAAARGFLR